MRAKFIALPIAAGLALGGATLATADPKEPPKPRPADERPALVERFAVPPLHVFGEPGPFGLHEEIAEDMAAELGLPADRVAEAMKKAIGAQFDKRRDEALKCFDDRKACAAAALPPFGPPARLVPRGRTVRP